MPLLYVLAPLALFALVVATALLVFTQPPSANSPLAGRRQSGATPPVMATTTFAPSLTPSTVVLTPSPSPSSTPSPTVVTPTATPSATAAPRPTAVPTTVEEDGGEWVDQQDADDRADTGSLLPNTGADPAERGEEQNAPQARGADSETAVTARTRSGWDDNGPDVPAASTANNDMDVIASFDVSTDDAATEPEAEDDGAIGSSSVVPEPTITRPAPAPPPALRIAIVRSPAGFTGTHLRTAPGQGAASLRLLPNGTRVQVLGPLAIADGFRWLQIRTLDGLTGWAVGVAL